MKKIEFDQQLELFDFREVLKEMPDGNFRLKEKSFKALIGAYAVRQLMRTSHSQEGKLERAFLNVSDPNNQCAVIARSYLHQLIGELPEFCLEEFEQLKKTKFTKTSILKDQNLMSFVSEFICEEINQMRNFEFGEYVIEGLAFELFSGVNNNLMDEFLSKVEDSENSFEEEIYDRMIEHSRLLSDFEKITLLAVYTFRFKRTEISSAYTYDYALRFKKDGLKLNQSMGKLKKVVNRMIDSSGKKKRKGRRI